MMPRAYRTATCPCVVPSLPHSPWVAERPLIVGAMHQSSPHTGVSPSAHDMPPATATATWRLETEPRKDRAVHLNCKEAELARQRSPGAPQRRASGNTRGARAALLQAPNRSLHDYTKLLQHCSPRPAARRNIPITVPLLRRSTPVAARDRELVRRPRARRHRTLSVAVAPTDSPPLPYPPCPNALRTIPKSTTRLRSHQSTEQPSLPRCSKLCLT